MIFIKPNGKVKQYGNLKQMSAIEPPLWIACLASYYGDSTVIDAEVLGLSHEDILKEINPNEKIIIFPTGSNSSGFFQQRESAKELGNFLLNAGIENVELWEKMSIDPTNTIIDWDLLPMDKYKAPNWHSWGRSDRKYGATFTSISCPYNCSFCYIKEFYSCKYRKRDLKLAVDDICRLNSKWGITNFKLMDEIFVLDQRRVKEFCGLLKATGLSDKLNIWAYARIDTITPELLGKMYQSGIRWVSYGIESGVPAIRKSYNKGGFSNEDIRNVVKTTHDVGMSIVGNFIFGLEDDSLETLRQTFDFAQELNCEFSNFFCYSNYGDTTKPPIEFAQYSPYFKPEATKYLTPGQVIKFRDDAFQAYYTDAKYLNMIEKKFGKEAADSIMELTKIRLERNLR